MRSRDASRLRAAIGPREAINNRGANQEVQFRPAAGLSDSRATPVVGKTGRLADFYGVLQRLPGLEFVGKTNVFRFAT